MLVHNIRSTVVLILVNCFPKNGNRNNPKMGTENDAETRWMLYADCSE